MNEPILGNNDIPVLEKNRRQHIIPCILFTSYLLTVYIWFVLYANKSFGFYTRLDTWLFRLEEDDCFLRVANEPKTMQHAFRRSEFYWNNYVFAPLIRELAYWTIAFPYGQTRWPSSYGNLYESPGYTFLSLQNELLNPCIDGVRHIH